MSENQMYVAIWRSIAAALAVVAMTVTGCVVNDTRAIESIIANGANPIDARCALGNARPEMCAVRAAAK